jgi:hypothetical protein
MRTKQLLGAVGAAAAILFAAAGAQASSFDAAISYSGGTQNLANPPYNLGFEFTTNSAFDVVSLGIYQAGQAALNDNHTVGLWDSSGNLLASTTINAPDGDVQKDGYDYNLISAVHLLAGQTYFIGAEYDSGADGVLFPGYGGSFTTNSAINYVQSTFGEANLFPNQEFGTNGFFGPNFGIAGVPEPASWAMMLMGFGALGSVLRRQRRAAVAA